MIFIYPAVTSSNCDGRTSKAMCKAIERFFLLQIQDAFASGQLSAKRKYDFSRKVYGTIALESKVKSGHLLQEAATTIQDRIAEIEEEMKWLDQSDNASENHKNRFKELYKELLKLKSQLLKSSDYNKPSSGGQYTTSDFKVDLSPTSGTVEVAVHYLDGPLHGEIGGANGAKKESQQLNIGVKVLPYKSQEFRKITKSLLDDYFATKSNAFFKNYFRTYVRKSFHAVKQIFRKLDIYNGMTESDVNSMVLGPSDFVNASAFKHNTDSPGNYFFTSSILMFNKDDLDEEYQDIFSNRSAVSRLFKLGWTTFCMLDPVSEEATFISSIDGGYAHVLPYSYLYESVGLGAIFANDAKLRNSIRPFRMKAGRWLQFSQRVSSK